MCNEKSIKIQYFLILKLRIYSNESQNAILKRIFIHF